MSSSSLSFMCRLPLTSRYVITTTQVHVAESIHRISVHLVELIDRARLYRRTVCHIQSVFDHQPTRQRDVAVKLTKSFRCTPFVLAFAPTKWSRLARWSAARCSACSTHSHSKTDDHSAAEFSFAAPSSQHSLAPTNRWSVCSSWASTCSVDLSPASRWFCWSARCRVCAGYRMWPGRTFTSRCSARVVRVRTDRGSRSSHRPSWLGCCSWTGPGRTFCVRLQTSAPANVDGPPR